MKYEANKESLMKHGVPMWFSDAKLGIFIHWGLYSVPAYAPVEYGDINETMKKGPEFHFSHNSYSEWYCNSIKLEGPYPKYHEKTYGKDFGYDDFLVRFNNDVKNWNPSEWAEIFRKIHAKYVVLTTKHHDGFLLWPSRIKNPKKGNYNTERDLVGELSDAVKKEGLKMGFYYSSLFDWSFQPIPISNWDTFIHNGPDTPEYAEYVEKHWMELIDRYDPDILWSDIGYPPDGVPEKIIAEFFNRKEEGIVNDRWMKISKKVVEGEKMPLPYFDFRTPEYRTYDKPQDFKFEVCRGIGRSFGYNKMELDEHHVALRDLIHIFIDIVSKNGNLLLDIGPTSDGKIPELQLKRLIGLGEWLDINGEAIFSTIPWIKAEGKTDKDVSLRFTQNNDSLFCLFLGIPEQQELHIEDLELKDDSIIKVLGIKGDIEWTKKDNGISVKLPEVKKLKHAITLKIQPKPR